MSVRRSIVSFALLIASLLPISAVAQKISAISPANSPELDQLLASKESGLLTDWRVAGPFGKSTDITHKWAPERDQLRKLHYGSHRVKNLQFATGRFQLPKPMQQQGVFYASSEVWLPNGGEWRIYAETAGAMMVFVDGKQIIERPGDNSLQTTSEVIHLEHGTHRVMVKFAASAAPFHLAVMPQTGGLRKKNNIPNVHAKPDAQYTVAVLNFPE